MTQSELEKLSDEDLIELVATKVMGWHEGTRSYGIKTWIDSTRRFAAYKSTPYPMADDDDTPIDCWDPLNSMSDCWMVVERMTQYDKYSFSLHSYYPRWLAQFDWMEGERTSTQIKEQTPQRAILYAALLAHDAA